jgi:uncharacterized membrane protein YeiH
MLAAIEFAAVISSAMYGILLGCRKRFDAVGMFAVSGAIAFGGGTLRDVFLDRQPLFWIAKDHYVAIVLGLSVLGSCAPRSMRRLERFLPIPDALGLALFSVTGAAYALEAGTSLLIASILAVVTGTFGGVIAEVICNEIPSLFRSAPLHATCSFIGAWVYLLLGWAGTPPEVTMPIGLAVIFLLRMAALKWDIRLPGAEPEE